MNKKLLILLVGLFPAFCFSQTRASFAWPIDTPHTITGNYGELRPNHFHMGWDFSTKGQINLPVYAIEDGYVSRLKVSSGGYGKAVYITYPGNKLSLCAHLTSYAGAIALAVRAAQQANQKYEVELFPAKDEIKVAKGELIGYSGNSGNSSGPHLHFEIRNEQTEVPLNPFDFYELPDTISPELKEVAFYSLADTNNPVMKRSFKILTSKNDSLFIRKDSLILNHSILGFAFAGFDRFAPKGNPNVIYSAQLFVDQKQLFGYSMNNISFEEQRYINEYSETVNKIKYQKCFLPTLYPVDMYANCFNKGRIILNDTNFHLLILKINDEHNNVSSLQFYFKTRKIENYATPVLKGDVFVNCTKDLVAVKKGIFISVPARSFYYSLPLSVENSLNTKGTLALFPAHANLAAAIRIGFLPPVKFRDKKEKLVLKNGSLVYSASLSGDSLYYSVFSLGHFELKQDTVAPKMKTQLTPKKIKRIKNFTSFSFIIRDNLSGLATYNLFLNDLWVLAEYDAKSGLLTYFFDEKTPPGNLKFRVKASDKTGNSSEYKFTLKRDNR
ncbi:MAG TPA: peptidoglycan DD-metalloendopeptidase family protein [Bacteroidia bacterium]|nr:peptidoglycan DD-metalloendopeptidase family protein [Bacteroidia bacterium]